MSEQSGSKVYSTEEAYIIAVPNPDRSFGIILKSSAVLDAECTYMFWLKIGDSRNVPARVKAYHNFNPSQKIAIIRLNGRVDNGEGTGPGKQLQTELFPGHREGGMLPGRSSEWFGVYGDKTLAATLKDIFSQFSPWPLPPTPKKGSNNPPSNPIKGPIVWQKLKTDTFKSIMDKKGPPTTRSKSSAPKYAMIAIIITPNILDGGLNDDFTVVGYQEAIVAKPGCLTYWIRLSAHYTRNESAYDLFSDQFRSHVPDFGYGAYKLTEEELTKLGFKHKNPDTRILDKLVTEGTKSLRTILSERYWLSKPVNCPDSWVVMEGPINQQTSQKAIQFLRSLVSTFDKYPELLWENAFPKDFVEIRAKRRTKMEIEKKQASPDKHRYREESKGQDDNHSSQLEQSFRSHPIAQMDQRNVVTQKQPRESTEQLWRRIQMSPNNPYNGQHRRGCVYNIPSYPGAQTILTTPKKNVIPGSKLSSDAKSPGDYERMKKIMRLSGSRMVPWKDLFVTGNDHSIENGLPESDRAAFKDCEELAKLWDEVEAESDTQ